MIVLSLPIMIVATCLSVLLALNAHLNYSVRGVFSKVNGKDLFFCSDFYVVDLTPRPRNIPELLAS